MTMSTISFLSYNSTGMNTLKTKWIRNLINLTGASFIQIQEHFKKNKSTEKFFNDQFPDQSSYIIPGYREQNQDSGRPIGGLAQLSQSNLDIKKNRVQCDKFRVQAQVLGFTNVKILWINAYLPTDPQLINYDETELLKILSTIEKIIETTNYDEIVWDKTRNTGFVACMDRWVDRLGLLDVWDSFPVSHTHVHKDMKSISTLDRFLVSPGLMQHIVDAEVLHLGDNPSRHSPIMLKIQIEKNPY
jgi:exonuclease III